MRVGIHRLRTDVQLPTYATSGSIGFDLHTAEEAAIMPGAIAIVGTGLVIATPPGWGLLICLRSSTPQRFGVIQPHGVGLIDQDYRGHGDELRLQLMNYTVADVTIPAGSCIAQGVFVPAQQATWESWDPSDTNRGGFGSTTH